MYINWNRELPYILVKKIICLLFVLGLLLFGGLSVNAETDREQDVTVQELSSFSVLDVMVIIDQSGSMERTDPNEKRVSAFELLVNSLMLKSDPADPHRLGAVNFGTDAPDDHYIPLTEIDNEIIADEIAGKVEALNLGWTNFIDPLDKARLSFEEADTLDLNRIPVVIIFTDGEPNDPRDLRREEYFEEIEEYVMEYPKEVEMFIIALDMEDEFWPECEPFWAEMIPEYNIFQIEDMVALGEKYNDIIRDLLGIPEVAKIEVPAEGKDFDVNPYLEAMELQVYTDYPDLDLELIKPDGTMLDYEKENVFVRELVGGKIIWVERPDHGTWRYQIAQERGSLEVFRNPFPVDVRLNYPSLTHPQGKNVELIVDFRYRDGQPVESIEEYPLNLTAELVSPSDETQAVPLSRDNGSYFSKEELIFSEKGNYELRVVVRGGDEYAYQRAFSLETLDKPYIKVIEPENRGTVAVGDKVNVKAKCYYNGEMVTPEDFFKGHPRGMALARAISLDENGEEGELVWLDWVEESGQWEKELAMPEGDSHILITGLIGELIDTGEEYRDETVVVFYPELTPMQRFINFLYYLGGAILFLLFFSGAYFMVWKSRLPKMQGRVTIESPEGRSLPPVRLDRKSFVRQPLAGRGIKRNGWIVIYSSKKSKDLIMVRWSKSIFRPRRLRYSEEFSLGQWKIKYH